MSHTGDWSHDPEHSGWVTRQRKTPLGCTRASIPWALRVSKTPFLWALGSLQDSHDFPNNTEMAGASSAEVTSQDENCSRKRGGCVGGSTLTVPPYASHLHPRIAGMKQEKWLVLFTLDLRACLIFLSLYNRLDVRMKHCLHRLECNFLSPRKATGG